MRTITLNPSSTPDTLVLGIRGEYNIGQIVFDYTAWEAEYGSGLVTISVKRSEDVQPYLVLPVIDADANTATWTLTETDTLYKGKGEIEFVYTGDDDAFKAKTPVYKTYVNRSLDEPTGDVPEPWQSVLDQMTQIYLDMVAVKERTEDVLAQTVAVKEQAEGVLADCRAVLEQIQAMEIPAVYVDGTGVVVENRS